MFLMYVLANFKAVIIQILECRNILFFTVSGFTAVRRCDTVVPASLNTRSLDELDAGTLSSFLATSAILDSGFIRLPPV